MEFLNTVFALIVTLGILVTIHEYGHFWVARRCGVKVLRFSVGFGKPLFSWRDRSGTEFVIALIPLGGYVSMLDEREGEVPDEQLSQAFNRKSVLQRIAVVAAGPLVNLAFAVLVYWAMFVVGVEKVVPLIDAVVEQSVAEQAGVLPGGELVSIGGRSTESWDEVNLALAAFIGEDREVVVEVRYPANSALTRFTLDLTGWQVDLENESPLMAVGIEPFRPSVPAELGELVAGGQAELAGLRQGDRVTHIDGVELEDWDELVAKVQSSPQQSLLFAVENNGVSRNVTVIPAEVVADDGSRIGVVGAAVVPVAWPSEMLRTVRYGVLESVPQAFAKTWQMISLTLDSIWKMLEGILSVKNLSGPITIAKVAGASAASGIEAFAGFLAYLSISLGILNLLPIPMLDGGHLLYYSVELFRGRPVSEKIQMVGLRIGMTLLFMLMGVAIFNDLMRL